MRAQIESQVLVYVLAVIVMVMVLIFGYQALRDLNDKAILYERIAFREDLSTGIKAIAGNYGSSKVLKLNCPFSEVCLVNLDHGLVLSQIPDIRKPIIENSVEDSVGYGFSRMNVFLCPPCTEQMNVGRIEILDEEGAGAVFRCFTPINRELRLTVEGLGDGVRIS